MQDVGENTLNENFVEKETRIKKSQPVKFSTQSFADGFKVNIEFNFSPYDSADIDQLLLQDSYLRTALRAFIKLKEDETKDKLIRR